MKKINGKQVKITEAGYLYIDGKKVSPLQITPVNGPTVSDKEINLYMNKWLKGRYVMVNVNQ